MLILPARNGAARPRIFLRRLSSLSKPLGELEVAPGEPCMHYSLPCLLAADAARPHTGPAVQEQCGC